MPSLTRILNMINILRILMEKLDCSFHKEIGSRKNQMEAQEVRNMANRDEECVSWAHQ